MVTLNSALGTLTSLSEGKKVDIKTIEGGDDTPAHDTICPCRHMHALFSEGIMIGSLGPFSDPDTDGCGYGCITLDTSAISLEP